MLINVNLKCARCSYIHYICLLQFLNTISNTTKMAEIRHITNEKGGAFIYEVDGAKLAEMVYVMAAPNKMIIEHTEVDDSLKGQGIGKKLQAELVAYVRENSIKVLPLCPFANATFKKMTEWQDVLV